MMVFGLGISMVVAITFTMQDLSTSVEETSAEVELGILLSDIRDRVLDIHSDFITWDGEISYNFNLDLPRLLIAKHSYEIFVEEKNNTYYLFANSSDVNVEIEQSLFLSTSDVFMSGSITSLQTDPYFSFQKNFTGQITLTFGNNT